MRYNPPELFNIAARAFTKKLLGIKQIEKKEY